MVNAQIQGVLVFKLDNMLIKTCNAVQRGLWRFSEDYLVGADKLMRSDSFLDPKNHSIEASFANPA